MNPEFDEYRDTPLWHAIESTIDELNASHEIRIDTAPAYVIGLLCRELVAKRVVAPAAVKRPS